MRTTPQVRFSLARRTIRATGFGCRHRAAISLRCQRNHVPNFGSGPGLQVDDGFLARGVRDHLGEEGEQRG